LTVIFACKRSLLLKRQLVVLVEGELDVLSVAQACADLVAVLATGIN
jgi:hypothetical protein